MKKKLLVSGAVLLVALVTSVTVAFISQKDLSPSETITAFEQKARSGDVEGSKQYIENDILEAFKKGGFMFYPSYEAFLSDHIKTTKSVKPITSTEKINGDMANVDVKINYPNGTNGTEEYVLIKEDNRWKIAK